MKTKIAILIALVALIICNITYAKAANQAVELTEVGVISEIEASGNVDVYIVNGDKDAVKVFDDYYGQNAIVKNVDGVLHIASYTTEKLMVLVTVSDLHAITANDNAFVKTYGDALSAKSLIIDLNDDAVAVLKLDVIAANITVDDEARAELYGMVENQSLAYSSTATVNRSDLKTYASRVREIEQPKHTTKQPAFRIVAGL